MASMKSTNVFVSYSHDDAALVAPVVKLLRVNKSLVFQDITDIQPGKKWRSEIAEGLAQSNLVVVFWCDHARRSNEVAKEWKAAVEQDKDLLPLLLDATPLPPELGEFQWIDFRELVGAKHGLSNPPIERKTARVSTPAARSTRGVPRTLVTAGLLTVLVMGLFILLFKLPAWNSPPPTAGSSPTPILQSSASPSAMPEFTPSPVPQISPYLRQEVFNFRLTSSTLILIALACAIAICVWLARPKPSLPTLKIKSDPLDFQRDMASKVEAEILRRTASKGDP